MPPFFFAHTRTPAKGPLVTALRALFRRNFGLACALLVLALLVRAAVPHGWMPESRHGAITVTLCTAAGPVEMHLPGKHEPSPQHERGQQPCAFGGLAHASTPPEPAPTLPLPAPVAEQYASAQAPFVLAQAARQMPPARGPPANA